MATQRAQNVAGALAAAGIDVGRVDVAEPMLADEGSAPEAVDRADKALYQAKKGGAVMFTFADFPQSPFRFREDNRPPRVPPRS